jgi:hypothetical protein
MDFSFIFCNFLASQGVAITVQDHFNGKLYVGIATRKTATRAGIYAGFAYRNNANKAYNKVLRQQTRFILT